MTQFLKSYGECTGPFGFPMKEVEARELDAFLQEHSKDSALGYKKRIKGDAFEYFIAGEKADVSKVTDSSIDKAGEVVDAKGVDWTSFQKNPVVTLSHNYWLPPVGKSVWQKLTGNAWKAKTIYAERPSDLPAEKEWSGDTIWHLIKSEFLKGKSIGFMPQKWHEPTKEDVAKDFTLKGAELIFDEVKVFEYAVCTVGCNDNAVVEDVAKSLASLPAELANFFPELQKFIKTKVLLEEKIEPPKGFKAISREQYVGMVKSELVNSLNDVVKGINYEDILAQMKGQV